MKNIGDFGVCLNIVKVKAAQNDIFCQLFYTMLKCCFHSASDCNVLGLGYLRRRVILRWSDIQLDRRTGNSRVCCGNGPGYTGVGPSHTRLYLHRNRSCNVLRNIKKTYFTECQHSLLCKCLVLTMAKASICVCVSFRLSVCLYVWMSHCSCQCRCQS